MSEFSMETLEEKIQKSESLLREELATVRAGRANAALVDKVMVDYYGTPTPLKALANISVPEPRTLLITPFDPKSIHEIEKAINVANIGITPANLSILKTGRAKAVRFSTLSALCRELDCQPGDLLEFKE